MTKAMTPAYKAAQDHRDMMNQGRDKVLKDDLSCVVYTYFNSSNQPCAVGYRGRGKKPAFHYRYASEESREAKIKEWMESQSKNTPVRRKRNERFLVVNDVLRASWGYEQTNIDYYMVTKLVGKTMVELVPIGQNKNTTGYDQGNCTPDKSNIIGEPIRKSVNGVSVRIDSVRYASKKVPEIINGQEVYNPDFWSSYA